MKLKLKIRFNLLMTTILLLSLLLSPLSSLASYDQSGAQEYLLSHSGNPWSVMALAAIGTQNPSTDFLKNISGSSAIEYEAPILAITAMGSDPRTFGQTDYVEKLKSFFQSGQIGDATAINDDIYGLLALTSAGVPATEQIITDTKTFIANRQNADGGWGFAQGSGSDSNTTASAMLALLATGSSLSDANVQLALDYLKTLQRSDGGFAYDSNSPAADSSSTAWVVWALNKLNVNPSTLSQSGNTPLAYLERNQDQSGYFKYQEGSSEDAFSAVTTAYAVIALSGKSLPIRTVSSQPAAPSVTYPFRIEGSSQTVCEGSAVGSTALDIVKNASAICGFDYHIKTTSFGPYLDKIGNDEAQGLQGWMYLANYASPPVGAADYALKPNDEILWYFGDYNWQPIRLSLSAGHTGQLEFGSGQALTVQTDYYSDGAFKPLAQATVYYGAQSIITDDSGRAVIRPQDGYYKLSAQKTGYVRSNSLTVKVGQPQTGAVTLSAEVLEGQVQGEATNTPDMIAFTVNPSALDFGSLASGSGATKSLTFSNTGTVDIRISAQTGGDALFTDYLKLNNALWRSFSLDLAKDASQTADASLGIPANTVLSKGRKSGQVVFWARAE